MGTFHNMIKLIKQTLITAFLLTIGISIGFGGKYLYQRTTSQPAVEYGNYAKFYKNADAAGIIMYGTSWCQYCKKTRNLLAHYNISYVDLDINQSDLALQQYTSLDGQGVPLLLIGDTRINGFRSDEILKALKLQNRVLE